MSVSRWPFESQISRAWSCSGVSGHSVEHDAYVLFEGQGQFFKIGVRGVAPVGGGTRGRIRSFSRASRKRFLEKFARVVWNDSDSVLNRPVFITLTYRNAPCSESVKMHLECFRRRVERRFGDAGGFWRLEFQERGAAHFHLILWGVPWWSFRELRRVWGEIIGEVNPRVRIERCRRYAQCCSYAAKYVGKAQEPSFLVNGAYSDAGGLWGRYWGVIRPDNIPFGERFEFVGKLGNWVYRLKRSARVAKKRVWGKTVPGFSLFLGSEFACHQWVLYAHRCASAYSNGGG